MTESNKNRQWLRFFPATSNVEFGSPSVHFGEYDPVMSVGWLLQPYLKTGLYDKAFVHELRSHPYFFGESFPWAHRNLVDQINGAGIEQLKNNLLSSEQYFQLAEGTSLAHLYRIDSKLYAQNKASLSKESPYIVSLSEALVYVLENLREVFVVKDINYKTEYAYPKVVISLLALQLLASDTKAGQLRKTWVFEDMMKVLLHFWWFSLWNQNKLTTFDIDCNGFLNFTQSVGDYLKELARGTPKHNPALDSIWSIDEIGFNQEQYLFAGMLHDLFQVLVYYANVESKKQLYFIDVDGKKRNLNIPNPNPEIGIRSLFFTLLRYTNNYLVLMSPARPETAGSDTAIQVMRYPYLTSLLGEPEYVNILRDITAPEKLTGGYWSPLRKMENSCLRALGDGMQRAFREIKDETSGNTDIDELIMNATLEAIVSSLEWLKNNHHSFEKRGKNSTRPVSDVYYVNYEMLSDAHLRTVEHIVSSRNPLPLCVRPSYFWLANAELRVLRQFSKEELKDALQGSLRLFLDPELDGLEVARAVEERCFQPLIQHSGNELNKFAKTYLWDLHRIEELWREIFRVTSLSWKEIWGYQPEI